MSSGILLIQCQIWPSARKVFLPPKTPCAGLNTRSHRSESSRGLSLIKLGRSFAAPLSFRMTMMQKLYVLLVSCLLLGSAPAVAQGDKHGPSAKTTPTALPGEEKLSAQERAERDFLMPVRRKQAATLRATAREEIASQPAIEVTARNLEGADAAKPVVEGLEANAATATVRHHTSYRRHSSSRRRSRKHAATSRKKSTAKKKKTTRRHRR